MVRRGIRDTLAEAVDIQVVGEAGNYAEVREVLRNQTCDILILDLNLPGRGGLEVLASVREGDADVRVLIVSMFAEDQYAIRCLRAGAHGYLNKAGDPTELISAVRTIAQGRKYVTPAVSEMLVNNLAEPQTETLHSTLSERELQTLLKIASGKKLSDISQDGERLPRKTSGKTKTR